MDKMFLVEKGKYVVVRDGLKEVAFQSFGDFNKYYPELDLTGKWYVDYEPERDLYIDSVLGINTFSVVSEYDAVISEIDTIIANTNNVYFGKTPEEVREIDKNLALAQISKAQRETQDGGYICSNGIKLQVRDEDLLRWTQLTATILAFQPETVLIRDYDNANHTLSKSEALQMMGEIASWGQASLASVWSAKDAVLNSGT